MSFQIKEANNSLFEKFLSLHDAINKIVGVATDHSIPIPVQIFQELQEALYRLNKSLSLSEEKQAKEIEDIIEITQRNCIDLMRAICVILFNDIISANKPFENRKHILANIIKNYIDLKENLKASLNFLKDILKKEPDYTLKEVDDYSKNIDILIEYLNTLNCYKEEIDDAINDSKKGTLIGVTGIVIGIVGIIVGIAGIVYAVVSKPIS